LIAGESVGQYKVTGKLGSGAMGTVYSGVDTQLGREVAIKVLMPEISRNADLVDRFRREATTLARLHHGNICSVYAFLEYQGEHLMILQYLQGRTLEDVIHEDGALGAEKASTYCKDVLSGLAEAHAAGVVHRDLKPANIMITPSGKAVIMDFGIARVRGEKRATREGMTVCTIEYASPEQIRGEDVDARSDLYSLGLVYYEMLEGRSPYSAATEYEWIKAHTQQDIDANYVESRYGKKFRQFIATSTHKDASKRFGSAGDMLGALSLLPITAEPGSGSRATGNILAGLRKINPVIGLSSLLLLGGAVFVAVAQFSSMSKPNATAATAPHAAPPPVNLTPAPQASSAPLSSARPIEQLIQRPEAQAPAAPIKRRQESADPVPSSPNRHSQSEEGGWGNK
jgi:eukaryotic-like serine/threonine-protein kinase